MDRGDWTEETLAKRLGVTRKQVSNWRTARNRPYPRHIKALRRLFPKWKPPSYLPRWVKPATRRSRKRTAAA